MAAKKVVRTTGAGGARVTKPMMEGLPRKQAQAAGMRKNLPPMGKPKKK